MTFPSPPASSGSDRGPGGPQQSFGPPPPPSASGRSLPPPALPTMPSMAPPGTPGTPPGTPPGGVPGSGMPLPPPAGRSPRRTALTVLLGIVGGLVLLAGGGLTAYGVSDGDYGATMWRNEPVDTLFPRTLGQPAPNSRAGSDDPKNAEWHRIGISDTTGCAEALDGALAAEAQKRGCEAVLRATYVDPTGNLVATVALVVLPDADGSAGGMSAFFDAGKGKRTAGHGVKAFPVPDTAAAGWKDADRNGADGVQATDKNLPYALAASAGSLDGRNAGHLPGKWGAAQLSAQSDRKPWRDAARSLATELDLYLGDLLLEKTS